MQLACLFIVLKWLICHPKRFINIDRHKKRIELNDAYCRFPLGFMVLNATFNNISIISWRSVLLVEETGVPGENSPTCCKSSANFIK